MARLIDRFSYMPRRPTAALLVGNGPSILDKPFGVLIDAFDGVVVRFNEFVLKPAAHTGTRTDLWVIAHRSHNIENMHPGLRHKIARVPRHIQYKDAETRFRSTGVAAMFWFLEEGFEVKLHGFDHFNPGRRVHYYPHDRGWDLCVGRGHPKDREMVQEVIREGKPVTYFNAGFV